VSELNSLLAELLSGDETRAEAAVPGLVSMGERAIQPLMEAAKTEDADQRWWAVRALAEIPSTRGEDLAAFLKDSNAAVRQVAALGLVIHPEEALIDNLAAALHDPDSMVASLASNALIKTGSACVPALLEVLKSAPQPVRILALRALVDLKDHRAIPVMMKILQEDSAVMGHWAEQGLERLGLNMVYIKPT
jgi:phycocyanobilin lyase beta subunit